MAKIQPGVYEATISNYGITTTKDGSPQVAILFNMKDQDGNPREITWRGTLKDGKGQEITLKTLLYCGFNGSDPSELAGGVESGVLDHVTPVRLTIEEQEYEGKLHTKVAWVNPIGAGMGQCLSKEEAKVKLGALNLRAQMEMMRQKTGIQKPTQRPTGRTREPGEDDDLDFGDIAG